MRPTRAPRPHAPLCVRRKRARAIAGGHGARTRAHLKRTANRPPRLRPTRAPRPHALLCVRRKRAQAIAGGRETRTRGHLKRRAQRPPRRPPTRAPRPHAHTARLVVKSAAHPTKQGKCNHSYMTPQKSRDKIGERGSGGGGDGRAPPPKKARPKGRTPLCPKGAPYAANEHPTSNQRALTALP